MRLATITELQEILNSKVFELEKLLTNAPFQILPMQFCIPLEGYPRIKVSVKSGSQNLLPNNLKFFLKGDWVTLPLEIAEDYQEYKLH